PSLGDGWIHLDPQAGMLVPDSVSRAVSTGFRTTSFSHVGRHGAARRSAAVLDAAREAVADLVGGDPAGVVLGPDRAVLLAWLAESLSSRLGQIGRASCRERAEIAGVAVSFTALIECRTEGV